MTFHEDLTPIPRFLGEGPFVAVGWLSTEFACGPSCLRFDGKEVSVGGNNLFVPDASERRIFVAPSLAVHYIDAHDYAPPDAFQQAVLECPPQRSAEYLKALLACGFRTLRGGPMEVP